MLLYAPIVASNDGVRGLPLTKEENAAPAAVAAALDARAERAETPCGEGTMVWRMWGAGRPLLLLHGGSGSWLHWIRNIEPLTAAGYRLFVPDIPGLGESASPPEPYTPESIGAIIHEGLITLLPEGASTHVVGFSFGGLLSGPVSVRLGPRLRSLTIVAASGLALPYGRIGRPKKWRGIDDEAERRAIHRHNLAEIMIGDPAHIDDMAVWIQSVNAPRARTDSVQFGATDTLARAIETLDAPVNGIYGTLDMAAPHFAEREALLKRHDPAARLVLIEGAGHWIAYEAADAFNEALLDILRANERRYR